MKFKYFNTPWRRDVVTNHICQYPVIRGEDGNRIADIKVGGTMEESAAYADLIISLVNEFAHERAKGE